MRKGLFQFALIGLAAAAILFQFIGFITPGWCRIDATLTDHGDFINDSFDNAEDGAMRRRRRDTDGKYFDSADRALPSTTVTPTSDPGDRNITRRMKRPRTTRKKKQSDPSGTTQTVFRKPFPVTRRSKSTSHPTTTSGYSKNKITRVTFIPGVFGDGVKQTRRPLSNSFTKPQLSPGIHMPLPRNSTEQVKSRDMIKNMNTETEPEKVASPMGLTTGKWSINMGLWYGQRCEHQAEISRCGSVSITPEISGFPMLASTWHDLRIETVFALGAGVIGFVATFLSVKPMCLKERRRVTVAIGVAGMALSCVLFLVPISRVCNINETLRHLLDFEKNIKINTSWSLVVAGIGACLALVTSGALALYTWMDERQKWEKFDNSGDMITKEDQGKKSTTLTNQANNVPDMSDVYDNRAYANSVV